MRKLRKSKRIGRQSPPVTHKTDIVYCWYNDMLISWRLSEQIEAETKWSPSRRRNFQMHCLDSKYIDFDYNFIEVYPQKFQLTTFQYLFRLWLGADQAKPLSEPMMTILLTRICVIRPQWIMSAVQCHCQRERWSDSRKWLPIVLFWRSNSTSFIHIILKCVKMDFWLYLDFADVTTFSHFCQNFGIHSLRYGWSSIVEYSSRCNADYRRCWLVMSYRSHQHRISSSKYIFTWTAHPWNKHIII